MYKRLNIDAVYPAVRTLIRVNVILWNSGHNPSLNCRSSLLREAASYNKIILYDLGLRKVFRNFPVHTRYIFVLAATRREGIPTWRARWVNQHACISEWSSSNGSCFALTQPWPLWQGDGLVCSHRFKFCPEQVLTKNNRIAAMHGNRGVTRGKYRNLLFFPNRRVFIWRKN